MSGNCPDAFGCFTTGIHAVFVQWTALRLAVEHCDDGNAQQIADQAEDDLISWFREEGIQNEIFPDEVEDFLFDVLANELHADVQDGSIEEVSRLCCRMFKECAANNFDTVRAVEAAAQQRPAQASKEEVHTPLPDAEDMEEDGDDGDAGGPGAPIPPPAPLAKTGRARKVKQVDADGWETVGRR